MATAQDVINRVKLTFPGESDTSVLGDLQIIDNELRTEFRITPTTETLSSIVAGTAEYAINAATLRVWNVRWFTSATQSHELQVTHKDELDEFDSTWRRRGNGTPRRYYIDAGNIGFVKTPDTTTSASYPQARVEQTRAVTLVVGTTMPAHLPDHEAWVAGVLRIIAARVGDSRYLIYEKQYEQEKAKLTLRIAGKPVHYRPKFLPAAMRGGRGRV